MFHQRPSLRMFKEHAVSSGSSQLLHLPFPKLLGGKTSPRLRKINPRLGVSGTMDDWNLHISSDQFLVSSRFSLDPVICQVYRDDWVALQGGLRQLEVLRIPTWPVCSCSTGCSWWVCQGRRSQWGKIWKWELELFEEFPGSLWFSFQDPFERAIFNLFPFQSGLFRTGRSQLAKMRRTGR